MAYNNPQYSGYVSTSANTQAVQQGLAMSTARQAQIAQAREQLELKERKAANNKIEKTKDAKTAAFNNQLSIAVSTGKVTDVEGAFGGLRDQYYDLVQQYGAEDADKTTLDFEMSKILGMVPAFVTNFELQSVDAQEWQAANNNEKNPGMNPMIGEYLDTISQSDGYQPSQYDEFGNLTVGGYDITYEADTKTATWNTIVTQTKIGEDPTMIKTVNSGAYSLNPQGMFNITEGPLNTQTKIATEINLFALDAKGKPLEGVLNDEYSIESINYLDGGYEQRVKTPDINLIKSKIQNATDVQASSYLIDPTTAATAWNNNFIKPIPQNIQDIIDLENKALAVTMTDAYNQKVKDIKWKNFPYKYVFEGSKDQERIKKELEEASLIASMNITNNALEEAELKPEEYKMWNGDKPITPEQTRLMKEGTMRSFLYTNRALLKPSYPGSSERPYKGNSEKEVSKQIQSFRNLDAQVRANNINGKTAFWTLNEDKTAYELRQYNEIDSENMPGQFDMVLVNGFSPIAVGDETAFNAAF